MTQSMALRVASLRFALLLFCGGCAGAHGGDVDAGAHTADAGRVKLPAHVAGKACKTDAQCAPGHCAKTLSATMGSDAPPAPGGYCTGRCVSAADCGAGAACAVPAGASTGQCLASCSDQSGCRDGYACVGAGRASGISVLGSCQPLPKIETLGNGVAGAACASDTDCKGGRCASQSPLGTPFPGNYCTGTCAADGDCGTGGACLVLAGSSGAGQCFERCSTDAGCTREGYRCRSLDDGFSACYPAPPPLPDGAVGSACSTDAECGGTEGTCASTLPFRNFSNYESIAAPDGYCSEPCSLHADCGANGACISRGMQGGTCLLRCVATADCRGGYDCIALSFLVTNDRVCVPTVPTP
jgi:hypothetical protein